MVGVDDLPTLDFCLFLGAAFVEELLFLRLELELPFKSQLFLTQALEVLLLDFVRFARGIVT